MALDNGNSAEPLSCDSNTESLKKLIELYQGLQTSTISYYELFGLSEAATADEIREAFLDFAVVFHPDHIFSLAIAEIGRMADFVFAEANLAYEILNEEASREECDDKNGQLNSANFKK